MKKILAMGLSLVLVLSVALTIPAFSKEKEITVYIDGEKIEFDVNPEIIEGRTMVPLRKIFEEIGALVKWDEATKTITARKSSKTITLTVDSDELIIDKGKTDDEGNPITETVKLEVPPQIVEGRTLVPARAISESFGLSVSFDEAEKKVSLESEKNDESWKENEGSIDLTKLTFDGDGIEIKENNVIITKGGDFEITGTLKNGSITVNAKERVKLRLNGVSVTTGEGPAIFFEETDKAFITVSGDSENYLVAKNSEDGAIYSKENLEIKGKGSLEIESPAGHGIKASDNLTIEEGNIKIDAESDGIHVNETFKMTGGNLYIKAVGDGIDSESIVMIEGGRIDIETNGEPIKNEGYEETAEQNGRRFPMMEQSKVEFAKSSKGINAEWMMVIKGGEFNIKSAYHAIHCADEILIEDGEFELYSEYGKGISAHGNLTVSGSKTDVNIEKSTEGIESKNVLTVNNGKFFIRSSDDAINATGGGGGMMPGMGQNPMGGERTSDSGRWQNGTPAAEGEATEGFRGNRREQKGEVNGESKPVNEGEVRPGRFGFGEMPVNPENGEAAPKPEDFGKREGGNFAPPTGEMPEFPEMGEFTPPEGAEPPSDMPRPGGMGNMGGMFGGMGNMGGMGRNSKDCLIINGGTFEIFGGDDCIDANGNLKINGGVIKASYPSGSFTGNFGVLDSDGQLTVGENVTLIFATGSGSERSLNLGQNSLIVNLETSHEANEKITVTDKSGEEVLSYTALGKFSTVLLTSDKLTLGETYDITVGEEKVSVSLTDKNMVVGERASGNSGSGRNFFGRQF